MLALSPAVSSFIADYNQASPRTVVFYRSNIERSLLPFLTAREVYSLPDVTPTILREWLAEEAGREYQRGPGAPVRKISTTTISLRYQSAHRFFEWCVEQEFIPASPMRKVRRPRSPQTDVRGYDAAECKALLKEAKRTYGWLGKRDFAIVMFLLDTGARASELLGLTPTSFDWPRRRVQLFGKGGKRRWVPVGPKASAAVREYLAARPESSCPGVWITQHGDPFDYGAMYMMLRNLGAYTGIAEVRPHRFRHTYAAAWYTENRDIMALKGLLGHSKVMTTQGYLQSLGIDYGSDKEYKTPGETIGL